MKLRDMYDIMTAVQVGADNANKRIGGKVSRAEYMKLYNGYDATFRAFKELYDERQETEKRIAELERELAEAKEELAAWQALGKRQHDDRNKTISLMEHILGMQSRTNAAGVWDENYDAIYDLFYSFYAIYSSMTDYWGSIEFDYVTLYSQYLESEMLSALMRGFSEAVNKLSESDALCRLFAFPEMRPLDEDGDALEYLLSLMEARLSEISSGDGSKTEDA